MLNYILTLKLTRNIIANKQENVEYKIACIGDKSKIQLQRTYGNIFLFCCNQYGRVPPTFEDASAVANSILMSGYNYDGVNSHLYLCIKYKHIFA